MVLAVSNFFVRIALAGALALGLASCGSAEADSGKPKPAQAFATLIEGMDRSLGDILDHLDALDVSRNTLVFFLGDNGSDAPLGDPHAVACAAPLRGKKGAH